MSARYQNYRDMIGHIVSFHIAADRAIIHVRQHAIHQSLIDQSDVERRAVIAHTHKLPKVVAGAVYVKALKIWCCLKLSPVILVLSNTVQKW